MNNQQQEQWIIATKEALKGGPVRFTYEKLRIHYTLRDHGDEEFPRYSLSITNARGGMVSDTSYGTHSLEEVLEDHPLDRFTPERSYW